MTYSQQPTSPNLPAKRLAPARNLPAPGHDSNRRRTPMLREAVQIQRLLLQGFGAEDIALKLHRDADMIRRFVAVLRRNGILAGMFGGAR